MELRHLRYFLAVAEDGSVTRAAARLYVAQPSLSQQIRALERELGVQLFHREPTGLTLTHAGATLLPRARSLLDAAEATQAAARELADVAAGRLRVGIFAGVGAGEWNAPILRTFRTRHPGVQVRTVAVDYLAQDTVVADSTVDVLLARPPVSPGHVRVDVLATEPRVAWLPADHPLAEAPSVTIEELADDVFVRVPADVDPAWRAHYALPAELGGQAREGDEPAGSLAASTVAVAYEGLVSTSAAATARLVANPDVAFVPLVGVAPSEIAVVSREGDPSPLVRDFRATAVEVVHHLRDLVPDARLADREEPAPDAVRGRAGPP